MTMRANHANAVLAPYADGPAQLQRVLTGLRESDLDFSLSPDTWTVRQIVHHIADGDDVWKTCIKAALGNHDGLFSLQWYWDKPQTEWAENWRYASRSIGRSLDMLRANRLHIVDLVQGIPEAAEMSIRLRWPDGREEHVTVQDVLEMQTRHLAGHVDDIQSIRRARNI